MPLSQNRKKWLWAIVLPLVITLSCINFWLKQGVMLNFTYTANQITHVNITVNAESEPYVVPLTVPKAKNRCLDIMVPLERVNDVMLTFPSPVNGMKLHGINVKGSPRLSMDRVPHFTPSANLSLKGKKGMLHVNSTAAGEVLKVRMPGSVEARWRVNAGMLVSLLVIPFYLVFVISDYIEESRKPRGVKSPIRLANVEFLRILFTFYVLITHFFSMVFNIWTSGGQGVEFFFILSGYLLAVTYKPERSMVKFALQKYVRFVPLVVVGGFLCSGGWDSLYGVFMLQATGLSAYGIPNTPAWYIGVLFWCSLLYLGIFKALPEKPRNLLIGVITFVACLFAFKWQLVQDVIPRSMLRGLSCIGIGCLLAQCYRRDSQSDSKKWTWGYTIAEIAVLFYVIGGCFSKSIYIEYWIYRPISLTLLLWLFLKKEGFISNLCERPVFVHLAKYSLGVYLTHWMFGTTVRTFVENNYPGWMENHVALSITIAMVGSCLLGALAYYIVEIPCARYLGRLLPSPKS